MHTLKIGVREFREQMAHYLEADTPVAVTRRGETIGIYIPTPRKHPAVAQTAELKAAADRLAAILADVDEDEIVSEFEQLRSRKKSATRSK